MIAIVILVFVVVFVLLSVGRDGAWEQEESDLDFAAIATTPAEHDAA